MWGGLDSWVPLSLMERWKKDLPHARFVVFEKASHVPMEEFPEETVAVTMEFMKPVKSDHADKTVRAHP
jgi:pimeloyl-ACP methyl ester carboxylesterase